MPKRKKKATEMTTEELARRIFPKKVVRLRASQAE